MKKISFLLILLFCSMFFACETEVKNPYLLYEPKLVIRAFLYADEVVQGITISKTIHPLAPSKQLESSFIKDAKVIISTQEMDFKCYYNGSSYCCDELYLQAGETYNLSVKYEDMIATATTIIPDFNIEKVYYTIDSGYYNSFYNFRAKMYAKISSSKPFSFYS